MTAPTRFWSQWRRRSAQPGGNGPPALGGRLLLWVDGVGGYLTCLDDEVWFGQAAPGNRVQIPLQADISRRHAAIARRGEGYVLRPAHATRVNGRRLDGPRVLADGDVVQLGDRVRLRFRQPCALSLTARIELLTPHRTTPSADAVLLMAESCVLGPHPARHVVCPDWSQDVVLYRRDDGLYCRAEGPIEVNGRTWAGRAQLVPDCRISGEDFSLSVEAVG